MNGLKTKIFLFALAVGILSGCKGKIQEQTSGNIQTISLVMDEQYLNGFNQILQEFENSHPNIKVSASSFPAYMEYKRMLYVSSFNSPDTDYDLYCISDSWIYEFAERKYIQPISNISDIALNQFNNQALNMFLISDKLYALPLFMDTWLLYYKDSKTNDREWQNNLADVSLPGINDDSLVEFIMAYKTAKDCSIKDAIEFYKKWYTYRDTKKQNYSNEFTSGTTHYLLAKCVDKNDIENNMTDLNTKIIISQNAEKKYLLSGVGLAVNSKLELSKYEAIKEFIQYIDSNAVYIEISKKLNVLPVAVKLQNHHLILDSVPISEVIFSHPENLVVITGRDNDYELRREAQEKLAYYLMGELSIEEVCAAFEKIF